MLIGLLVELHVGLHSCLCFSHLEKLLLKSSSTPPQYLLDTLLSIELIQLFLIAIPTTSRHLVDRSSYRESSCLLDSFSTLGGSIELLFLYQMIYSSTPPQYLYLSKTIFSIPSLTDISTPLDTFICRDLLRHYLFFLVQSEPYFIRSFSR